MTRHLIVKTILIAFLWGSFSHPTFSGNLNAYLGSENAQIGICGNMPVERKRRDCISASDLKQCLNQDKHNPLYILTAPDTENYLCINTSSTSGSQIIEEMVLSSENSCLSENVNSFYSEIIDHPEFQEISQQFKENLGIPLRLNYAIDTLNSVSSIQLDLKEYRTPEKQEEDITLTVSPFNNTSPCLKVNPKNILKKVSEELARLTIKDGSKEESILGEAQNSRVFDASRFSRAMDKESSADAGVSRKTASQK